MTTEVFDVAVVGAGIVGASAAFHLAERGLRVVVLEARGGHAEGSTGLSFASVRAQWADPLNTEISWNSIQRWRDFPKKYGLDVGYQANGYLLLFPEEVWEKQLEAVALQRSYGVPVEVLTFERAQELSRFDAAGLGGVTWGRADGQIDPHGATGAFLELAKRNGAVVRFNFAVDRAEPRADGDWVLGAGQRSLQAHYVVNAAGGWGAELGALAGFDVPVVHSRRNIYATAEGVTDKYVPMTVDAGTGIYFRSEGSRILIGGTNPGEPDGYHTQLDWEWLEGLIERGAERFPWLLDAPLDRGASWAGTYENTPDHDAILGPEPGAPTWVHACGFSGHGLMQAPEVGRLVAEQVKDGAMTSYDVARLSVQRFRQGSHPEHNISLVF
ncbi:MAG: FAD-dependent oxidoreductase [Nocardioidaceae bacterium]